MRNIFKINVLLMTILLVVSTTGCDGKHKKNWLPLLFLDSLLNPPPPAGPACSGVLCVNLGTAGNLAAAGGYAILAKDGVSTVPSSVVTGNVGLSPKARIGLTGWSESYDATDTYATSAQVVAPFKLYAADSAGGTTGVDLGTAVLSMQAAYTNAAGRPHGVGATNLNLGGGTLTGLNLVPGTYTWDTNVHITGNITLTGTGTPATDVWILQISGTLDMDANKRIILAGGALPQNIFWQVADVVTINEGSHFEGIILAQTMIAMKSLASINGRLLAQSAVTLIQNRVTQPTIVP